jgi:hypothetical protein
MQPDPLIDLSPTGREAFQTLLAARQFEESFVGFGAQPSDLVAAYRLLLKESAADAAFKQLLEKATLAGQLYGLCGVYFTDHPYFLSIIESYRGRTDAVPIQSGCMVFGQPMSRFIDSGVPNAIRLSGPQDSLLEWRRVHPESNQPDIIGGGYSHQFSMRFGFS